MPSTNKTTAYVWDLPTRLFHWALVILVTISFITAEIGGNAMQYHVCSGETILALLLFRLIWGFVGSRTARFVHFVRGPAAAWRYARSLLGPDPERHLGHNPLGGWSIVAMLLALALQAITGLFATDDIATQGPLNVWVSESVADPLTDLHEFNAGMIIALVALHISAVLFYLLVKKENLVAPMITGRKPWQDPIESQIQTPPVWVAFSIALLSGAAVYLLVR
ncbi:MAG: cytochrome b/b6 domain-containing protein [Desulfatitalea sp.]|nr:cytochrome b/b6 domain-containing protein [Desulfatitalea sp.]